MTACERFLKRLSGPLAKFAMAALLSSHAASAIAEETLPTPAQPKGPFYPQALPDERDNDLASVAGRAAEGQPITIVGRIYSRGSKPIPGAKVEIWQTNARGRYHHKRDASAASWDPGFQGWGETRTGADGSYRFRTIKPVAYGGRAPHVHFAVSTPGGRTFYTQMYLEGTPENARDFLFAELSEAQRSRLATRLEPPASGAAEASARFDIVIP